MGGKGPEHFGGVLLLGLVSHVPAWLLNSHLFIVARSSFSLPDRQPIVNAWELPQAQGPDWGRSQRGGPALLGLVGC